MFVSVAAPPLLQLRC